jgi:hypothetical protein
MDPIGTLEDKTATKDALKSVKHSEKKKKPKAGAKWHKTDYVKYNMIGG